MTRSTVQPDPDPLHPDDIPRYEVRPRPEPPRVPSGRWIILTLVAGGAVWIVVLVAVIRWLGW